LFKKAKTFAIVSGLIVAGALGVFAVINFATLKLQLKFKDRESASDILAEILKSNLRKNTKKNTIDRDLDDKREKREDDIIVLGIPRGGAIIADVIARKLSTDFDIVIARKVRDPENREQAIGAVMGDDDDAITYMNPKLVNELQISNEYIQNETSEQLKEVKRKTKMYRKAGRKYKIKSRTVILVDDGAATGATIIAAARWVRKQEPKHLIIALPVAPQRTINLLKKEADAIEVITSPSFSHFRSVEQFYQNFDPVTDEQVIEIMRNRGVLL
jgi:putative phosphoribosyl transferase